MQTLAQRFTRRVEFTIGGRAWQLVYTHRALLYCEEIAGVDTFSLRAVEVSASVLRALLYSALSIAGAPCSLTDVGQAIQRRLNEARARITEAWDASMAEVVAADATDEPSPTEEPAGRNWLSAWADAREMHGLSDEEWLDITPRMFAELQRVRLERMRYEELRLGVISSTLAAFSFSPPKQRLTAKDFMLHPFPAPKAPEFITGEHIMSQLNANKR